MRNATDLFAEHSFGKVALQKLAPVPANFRLYAAEWLETKPGEEEAMRVTGAEFRAAIFGTDFRAAVIFGKARGRLCVHITGTERSVLVTRAEMDACDNATDTFGL